MTGTWTEALTEVPLRLVVDHSCRRLLAWRGALERGVPIDALEAPFAREGLALVDPQPGFVVFEETRTRHRVLVVPSTGRLQVRLHYTTPEEERPREAARIGEALGRALEDAGARAW